MDSLKLIIKPKKISGLLYNYFKIFIQNIQLLFLFNLVNVFGFYLIIGQVIDKNFMDDYLQNYILKTFLYVIAFTFPVSFISAFYLTIVQKQKPIFKNIIQVFSANYIKILTSSLALTAVVFTLNLTLKSELVMYQYENIFTFLIIELINNVVYFILAIIAFRINPYQVNLTQYFSKKTIKYLITFYILMIISNIIYRLSFSLMISLTDLIEELTDLQTGDLIYTIGTVIVEYINAIAIFTILIYIYYNLTAELKNSYSLNEINQIKIDNNENL